MIRTRTRDQIGRRAEAALGCEFLESRLVVLPSGPLGTEGDVVDHQIQHELLGRLPAGVDENGTEKSLQRVGQDRFFLAAAGLILALAEQQMVTDVDSSADVSERRGVDDRSPQFGELPLGKVGVVVVDEVGDSQPENGVAQELEALIRFGDVILGAIAPMCEREDEKRRVLELVAESFGEFDRAVLVVQDWAPTCP